MAKKGAVQQLQAELNSDEDFEKFMERDGLLVLDVYTEWCGPCVGMIGSLKKIKLELGGDNLQLSICKADTVSYMERFRNKSEPTWLFASHNKIVNCLFGTNVPELMQAITDELTLEEKYKAGEYVRKFYEWTELTPIEQERENVRLAKEEEICRIELAAAKRRRAEYLTFVTDEIMERLPDVGVTLVMSNYAKERDIQKKLGDPADKCGLVMKDRRFLTIQESDLEVLLFDLTNPLHNEIYKKLFTEEILAVYWKTHDTELRDALDLIKIFIDTMCNPQDMIDETGQPDPEYKMPPIFKPWKFEVPEEVYKQIVQDMGITEEAEEKPKENAEAPPNEADGEAAASTDGAGSSKPPSANSNEAVPDVQQEKTTADAATGAPDAEGSHTDTTPRSDATADTSPRSDGTTDPSHDESQAPDSPHSPAKTPPQSSQQSKPTTPPAEQAAPAEPTGGAPVKDEAEPATEQLPGEIEEAVLKTDSKTSVTLKQEPEGMVTLNVPAIYAAANKRGNASLIYLYFRHLTDHFLPPDPVPEPPHVAVIFDAIKRKDICQLIATLEEKDVLAYGYFTGIDPDTAHLLAKTHDLYAERKFNVEDKLVLKVAKKTSNTLLTFISLGPTFVSFNTEEGDEECKKFFPIGYNEEDDDDDDASSMDSSSSKKKRKKKKKKDGSGSDIGITGAIAEETEEGAEDGDMVPDETGDAEIVASGTDTAPPGESAEPGPTVVPVTESTPAPAEAEPPESSATAEIPAA